MRGNLSCIVLAVWISVLIFTGAVTPSAATGSYLTITGYSALGQPGTATYGSGDNEVVVTYKYEAETNRLWTIDAARGIQSLLSLEHDYYPNGNVRTIFNYLNADWTQSFGYDELNRLTSAQSAAYGNLGYSYNKIGNIETKEGIVYSYNPSGPSSARPHAVSATSDGRTHTYDANGNLETDGERTIFWNYDNLPSSITMGAGGPTTNFVYDGNGQRVKKTGPAGTTIYIDDCFGSA